MTPRLFSTERYTKHLWVTCGLTSLGRGVAYLRSVCSQQIDSGKPSLSSYPVCVWPATNNKFAHVDRPGKVGKRTEACTPGLTACSLAGSRERRKKACSCCRPCLGGDQGHLCRRCDTLGCPTGCTWQGCVKYAQACHKVCSRQPTGCTFLPPGNQSWVSLLLSCQLA